MARNSINIDQLREMMKGKAIANLNPHLFPAASEPAGKQKSRSKFGNRKVAEGDREFDSKKEREEYRRLRMRLKAGEIGFLACQVEFALTVQGIQLDAEEEAVKDTVAVYIADFHYVEVKTGKPVVVDVKSEATRKLPTYRLKKKLMKAIYKIEIIEV
jgi:hypothetical protein